MDNAPYFLAQEVHTTLSLMIVIIAALVRELVLLQHALVLIQAKALQITNLLALTELPVTVLPMKYAQALRQNLLGHVQLVEELLEAQAVLKHVEH